MGGPTLLPKCSGPAQKGSIERNQQSRGPPGARGFHASSCQALLATGHHPALLSVSTPDPHSRPRPHPEPDHFLPTPTPSRPCYLWFLGIEECPILGAENRTVWQRLVMKVCVCVCVCAATKTQDERESMSAGCDHVSSQ